MKIKLIKSIFLKLIFSLNRAVIIIGTFVLAKAAVKHYFSRKCNPLVAALHYALLRTDLQ